MEKNVALRVASHLYYLKTTNKQEGRTTVPVDVHMSTVHSRVLLFH